MKTNLIIVSVFDIFTNQFVINEKSIKEAAAEIGVKYKTFYPAMERESILAGRYRVIKFGVLPKKVDENFEEEIRWAEDWMEQWDKIYKNVQKIKKRRAAA